MVTGSDEDRHTRSDWHLDSILAAVCAEAEPARTLKRDVRGLLRWLARWTDATNPADRPTWNSHFTLEIEPLRVMRGEDSDSEGESESDDDEEGEGREGGETAETAAVPILETGCAVRSADDADLAAFLVRQTILAREESPKIR